jgi:hypothetical protein
MLGYKRPEYVLQRIPRKQRPIFKELKAQLNLVNICRYNIVFLTEAGVESIIGLVRRNNSKHYVKQVRDMVTNLRCGGDKYLDVLIDRYLKYPDEEKLNLDDAFSEIDCCCF